MKIKSLSGNAITITRYTALGEKELAALKWACLSPEHHGSINPKELTPKQKKQLLEYAFKEAETYSSGHSMRYTILRDVVKIIFEIKP